jgi:acetolactate synthase-1/3 small subunit
VITESGYTILETSRTGRMAMRRGHHTSRVLKALGTNGNEGAAVPDYDVKPSASEILPNQFEDVHEEEA